MRATRHAVGMLILIHLAAPLRAQATLAQGTPSDSLQRSLEAQAVIRFHQAGLELTPSATRQLKALVAHGVDRLNRDSPTPVRVATARRSLNAIVDGTIRMVEASGTTVVDSVFGLRPCRPPQYPYCP